MSFDELSLGQKADIIGVCVRHGIYNLNDIRIAYNRYTEGKNIFGEGGTLHPNDIKAKAEKFRLFLTGGKTQEEEKNLQSSPPVELAYKNPWPYRKLYPAKYVSAEEQAIKRANQVYSNYEDAKDAPNNPVDYVFTQIRKAARNLHDNGYGWVKSGISNCTLTATQWADPNNPIRNAQSIHRDPRKYGYTLIDSLNAVPGNLLIAQNPENRSYHTMLISGFVDKDGTYNFDGKDYPIQKGEPLLTYSRGGHNADAIRRNVPLSVYAANSDGHIENLFYRYNYPNEVFLPEITVTGKKRAYGGYFRNGLSI